MHRLRTSAGEEPVIATKGMAMDTIFTLDARENIILEVVRDHFGLSEGYIRKEIARMFDDTLSALTQSGVDYSQLKSALVPQRKRYEAGFVFDSTLFESTSYGPEALRFLLPLMPQKTPQSVLCGDLIASDEQQGIVVRLLEEYMNFVQTLTFRHSTLLYCIYVNNLSGKMLETLNSGLLACNAYIGYMPITCSTTAKDFLSTTLINSFVKTGNTVLLSHEDDRPDVENVNITLNPFEELGCDVRSVQQLKFRSFLSYKIERRVLKNLESDTSFALNAISNQPVPLEDLEVKIDDNKYEYLLRCKEGTLSKAGYHQSDKGEIEELIKAKLASNYMYNLRYREEYDVSSFNIILEVPDASDEKIFRYNAALEYIPKKQLVRLITLY